MKRTFVLIVLPFTIIWSFISRLVVEIPDAFGYAWHDAQMEIRSAKHHWNDNAQSR